MDTQHTPPPNLETPFDGPHENVQPSETTQTLDEHAKNTPSVELQSEPVTAPEYLAETAPESTDTTPLEPALELEPATEPLTVESEEKIEPANQLGAEPFMPTDTPLDVDLPEEEMAAPEIPEPLNKSFFIVAAIRVGVVALISIFFMRLFGGAGSTCSTTALPLNYACSLNYLWLAVVGVCSFAIIERIISKVLHKKYSHVMPVAGFILATFTFYQVSQVFAALNGSQQKLPNISMLHFMPALVTVLVTATGLMITHFIFSKKVRGFTTIALPISALVLIIFLPIVLTEHFTTLALANQVRAEKTIKTNLKNTATAAAAAGVNLYIPKNYTGPLQIKYVKPFFKTGDYPRYVLTFQLPNGKNLEMIDHKKDTTDNPPSNCGDFLPYTIKPSTNLGGLAFPCKQVLTTDSVRTVYGFYDSSITDTIKLSSKEILKYQPSAFYIYVDNVVISFLDTTAVSGQVSTITPDVLRTFVDSLQPLKEKELQDFIDKYGV